MPESSQITVGAAIARFLEHCGVRAAFGVISIHNMPMLDPLLQRGRVRYIMARGEAGAANMADAYARVTGGLGVFFTSTGTAAARATPARRRGGWPIWALAWSPARKGAASCPRTTRARWARTTCTNPWRRSIRRAMRCWSPARACAATKR
jgi:hypothetical protein